MIIILSILTFSLFLSTNYTYGQGREPGDVIFIYEPDHLPAVTKDYRQKGTEGGIAVSAESAIVMDVGTGQVLYAKNAHKPRPIASTTKIMTALVAIQYGDLKGVATISQRAAGVEGSSIYLKAGEKLSLEELLYGALMHSGNDACVAIAEQVAGEEKIFVTFMNYMAHRLGAKNTHFCNTNGLPNDRHLSSAYDLALITRHALQNPVFSKIVSTRTQSINGPKGNRFLSNTNKMLWSYQGANGVKTGTTQAAGKCLVASASRDGRRLVAVVLHSSDRYTDSIKLLDYGYAGFYNEKVANRGDDFSVLRVKEGIKEKVAVTVPRDLIVTVPVGEKDGLEKIIMLEHDLQAPVKQGQVVGKVQVLVGDKLVSELDLVAKEGVVKLPAHKLVLNRVFKRLE